MCVSSNNERGNEQSSFFFFFEEADMSCAFPNFEGLKIPKNMGSVKKDTGRPNSTIPCLTSRHYKLSNVVLAQNSISRALLECFANYIFESHVYPKSKKVYFAVSPALPFWAQINHFSLQAPAIWKEMSTHIVRGIYKHYKGGVYKVLNLVKHTETEERLVVYRSLNAKLRSDIWARPLDMFLSNVKTKSGYAPRFVLIQKTRG